MKLSSENSDSRTQTIFQSRQVDKSFKVERRRFPELFFTKRLLGPMLETGWQLGTEQ